MTSIGIIRCEKNEIKCPLTSCIKSLEGSIQGFAGYDECSLTGVFTCRCPGDDFSNMVRILKAKGAETVHVVTCAFSRKGDGEWFLGEGFCPKLDEIAQAAAKDANIPVVKGTAHLPAGYSPEVVE